MKRFLLLGAVLIVSAGFSPSAHAYKFDVPGGVCPKDTRIQCGIKCDNGQTADYIKWTGAGWSDLINRIKDADANALAKKLIDQSNKQTAAIGGKADCK